MTKTVTFFCEYSILPERSTRDDCMTLFGGMTKKDDERELGNVKLLGRWACVGEARGYCIAQAQSVVDVQRWLNGWVSMADIKVTPCLDDNQQREMILGHAPSYSVSYDSVDSAPREGEDLYFIKYQFREGAREKGFESFANMTQEQDHVDSGRCTSYGRWHVPSQGCGYAIASSPSALDIYKWAYNWNALCDCFVTPVTRDEETRKIIQQGLGFSVKHKNLVKQIQQLQQSSGPCFVTARFTFKSQELKDKFLEILRGDQGLSVTRAWPGCQFIECYESEENSLQLCIRQKWDKESDHASYMEMRKKTGLFDSVMEMLSSPLEITHLNSLDC